MRIFHATFLFVAFCFLSLFSFSQDFSAHIDLINKLSKPGNDTVYYNFNRKLTWSDFQGKEPANAPWGAMTASGFSFDLSMTGNARNMDVYIQVYVFFTKHDSWKKAGIVSSYHLEHEQHHFDITRIYAQKFVDELRKAHLTRSNYQKLINSLFDKTYDESLNLQHQYDLETNHSIDAAKQAVWNKKIDDELKIIESGQEN